MVIKSVNGLSPQYISNMFNFPTNRENTRQYILKVLTVPPGKHKVVFEKVIDTGLLSCGTKENQISETVFKLQLSDIVFIYI